MNRGGWQGSAFAVALLSHIGNLPILGVQHLIMSLQVGYCGSHTSKSQAVWIRPKMTTLLAARLTNLEHSLIFRARSFLHRISPCKDFAM